MAGRCVPCFAFNNYVHLHLVIDNIEQDNIAACRLGGSCEDAEITRHKPLPAEGQAPSAGGAFSLSSLGSVCSASAHNSLKGH